MATSVPLLEPYHDEAQNALDQSVLQLAYEKSLRQAEALYDEERARQLHVQVLLLENENNSLHEQLASDDDRLGELHRIAEELQSQLDSAHNSLESTHSDLRLKSREIETLRIELTSLHEVTMDSTKLLTEKLALARELSSLKPEMDHLRSQSKSYEAAMAEKLSLQRQLSALQVDLEMERRATQRAIAKEEKLQIEETKSAARFESLQAELAKERKERTRIEREAFKASADWEAKQVTLETRMDSLKTKLKASKDQLKESESELKTAWAASRAVTNKSTASLAIENTTKDPRKRSFLRMDDDTVIGTPGDLRATKMLKRGSAMPGDKSTFSITPFLNRTSVALDSPVEECEDQAEQEDDETTNPESVAVKGLQGPSAGTKTLTGKPHGSKAQQSTESSNPLRKAKPNRINIKAVSVRKGNEATSLEQVDEEDQAEDPAPAAQQLNSKPADTGNAGGLADNLESKKRKRKMLGGVLARTLFDDDEAESVKGDKAGAKAVGTLGRAASLGGSKLKQRLDIRANPSGFGGFSPLKKDRKGRD